MPTKILAIDDSKTMRLAIKITFAAEDAEVTAVSKGSEAVVRAKQMPADVVLVDAVLAAGEPSGYDVCAQLKGDGATASIPVIILASGQTGVDAGKLKSCGADGSITKPFETQELIDKVAEVLGKPRTSSTQVVATTPTPPPAAVVSAAAAAPARTAAPTAAPTSVPPTRAAAVPTTPQPAARPTTSPPIATPAATAEKAAPALRLQPQAAAQTPAARPATMPPTPAQGEGAIPIAVPIPFTAASEPTPGMLARLKSAQGGATAGLDPRVAEAIVALSREVLEAVAWEVVPELAEQIVRDRAKAG
ncbi:MAG TPA: response regulator [Nannocystaceae bacterium]|nr:response regulator [Nannocystaceae bacterium]